MIYIVSTQRTLYKESPDIIFCDLDLGIYQLKKLFETGEVAVDSETTGLDAISCDVLTWQFGTKEDQLVIEMIYPGALMWIKYIFKTYSDTLWLFQNAKFDLKFLMKEGIYPKNVYDTFLAESILYNGILGHKKSLDALAMRYLGVYLDKSVRNEIHRGMSERVLRYAAADVEYLHDIKKQQEILLKAKDLERIVKLENRFVSVLAYSELCGLGIDHKKWLKKCEQDDLIREESIEAMNTWLIKESGQVKYLDPQLDIFGRQGVAVNWASPKQVVKVFNDQGLDLRVKDKKTGGFKDSVDAKVLAPQKDKSPLVNLYLTYSKADKICTTYGRSFLASANKITGRIHTSYFQIKDTGRISSGDKKQKLPNLQNIPATPIKKKRTKELYERECFITDKDNVFVDCDYGSQESVILANFSQEPSLLEFYQSGASDLHSFVASKLYPEIIGNTPLTEIAKKFPAERQKAKAANFAIAYGGNSSTIAKNLSVSEEVGTRVESAYFEAFPQLKSYFEKQKKLVESRGYVLINPISGRKTFIDSFSEYKALAKKFTPAYWAKYREAREADSPEFATLKEEVSKYFQRKGAIERMALNYPIQGTAGDQTKLAGIYLFEIIKTHNHLDIVKIVNFIHDEILLECPNELAETYASYTQECMERAGEVFCKIIKLKAEPNISKSWEH